MGVKLYITVDMELGNSIWLSNTVTWVHFDSQENWYRAETSTDIFKIVEFVNLPPACWWCSCCSFQAVTELGEIKVLHLCCDWLCKKLLPPLASSRPLRPSGTAAATTASKSPVCGGNTEPQRVQMHLAWPNRQLHTKIPDSWQESQAAKNVAIFPSLADSCWLQPQGTKNPIMLMQYVKLL